MSLAAMVDMVLEQMRKQPVEPLARECRGAALIWPLQIVLQAGADGDQTCIDRVLLGGEARTIRAGLGGFEGTIDVGIDRPAGKRTLHRVHVEPVHGQDVVQRPAQRREETRSRCSEFLARELLACPQQAVIRPACCMPLRAASGQSGGESRWALRVS